MYRKISMTPAEMLEMRAQGMSNRDIAGVLDKSYHTVLKYIGKQPEGMESYAAFKARPRKKQEEEKVVEAEAQPSVPKYSPKPIEETYRIPGMKNELLAEDGAMIVYADGDSVCIPYDSVPDLVQFLVWAMRERMEVTSDGQAEQVPESEDCGG